MSRHRQVACKLGTIPKLAWVHVDDLGYMPGSVIRVSVSERPPQRGQDWDNVKVEEVHSDGYFKATWL